MRRAFRLPVAVALVIATACVTACAAPAPAPAGRLVIGSAFEPDTLDPQRTSEPIADEILCRVGGSLLARAPSGAVVPWLASSWETSADGLTWTFRLRPGIRFHDGSPLTASDVVATFRRALDPATASPVAGALLGPVTGVTAPDDLTVRLTLSEPYAPLLQAMTECGYLTPLRHGTVADPRAPDGVGPYRFVSWQAGDSLLLERNPGYTWGPAFLPPGPPAVAEISYRFLPDPATRLAAFRAGAVDVTELVPDAAAGLGAPTTVLRAPLAGAAPLGTFNTAAPPFDDVRVRRAVNEAVDREALLAVVAPGAGEVQYGPLSRSVVGYWPGVEQIGYRYRRDDALALLAAAGYGPSDPLRVTLLTSPTYSRVAQVLSEQLRDVGIDLTVDVADGSTTGKHVLAGEFQMALVTIETDDSDVLRLLYHSRDASLPIARVTDPTLDALLDTARSDPDPQRRATSTDSAQARIVDQAYALPLYTPTVFTAVSARVRGAVLSSTGQVLLDAATLAEP